MPSSANRKKVTNTFARLALFSRALDSGVAKKDDIEKSLSPARSASLTLGSRMSSRNKKTPKFGSSTFTIPKNDYSAIFKKDKSDVTKPLLSEEDSKQSEKEKKKDVNVDGNDGKEEKSDDKKVNVDITKNGKKDNTKKDNDNKEDKKDKEVKEEEDDDDDEEEVLDEDEEEERKEKERERLRKEGRDLIKESHIKAYEKIMNAIKAENTTKTSESGTRVGLPYGEVQMHGFLYKRSPWYTKLNISSLMWYKRWFVLSDTFWYCPNPLSPEKGRGEIPLWKVWKVEVDAADPCIIKLLTSKRTYELRAVTPQLAANWFHALCRRIESVKEVLPQYYSESGLLDVDEGEDYVSTLEYPFGESYGHILFWVLTYPLALLLYVTVPDVRKDKCKKMFVLTFVMVCVWIGVMSYAMVWAADQFARVVGIPDIIMGLTITAFGSSLPSLFGSVSAAKQGTADMAISNAFGSSLSALVSIGIPCFIFSAFVEPGKAYEAGKGAILTTNFLLILSLIFFLLFAVVSKLRMNKCHGIIFIVSYFVFLTAIVLCEVFDVSFSK